MPSCRQASVQAFQLACMNECIGALQKEGRNIAPSNPSAPDPAQTPVQSSCQVAVLQSFMHESMQEGPRQGRRTRACKRIGP
jgi:hypothetical protein